MMQPWDYRYYQHQRMVDEFAIDEEEVRSHFPFAAVKKGVFAVYQSLFRLRFKPFSAPSYLSPLFVFFLFILSINCACDLFFYFLFIYYFHIIIFIIHIIFIFKIIIN